MATLVPRCRDAGEVCVASLANGRSLQGTAQWGFLLTFCERTAGLIAQNSPSPNTPGHSIVSGKSSAQNKSPHQLRLLSSVSQALAQNLF